MGIPPFVIIYFFIHKNIFVHKKKKLASIIAHAMHSIAKLFVSSQPVVF